MSKEQPNLGINMNFVGATLQRYSDYDAGPRRLDPSDSLGYDKPWARRTADPRQVQGSGKIRELKDMNISRMKNF